ncbi:MAG: hypothetical protein ACI8W7_003325 [Gammaproteobacteria bacterium]|jgi:hypothetical protein
MSSTISKSDFTRPSPSLPARQRTAPKHGLALAISRLRHWFEQRRDADVPRRLPHLQLEFPDRFVNFRGMKEFEFGLRSRTEFPATRVRELMALTPTELEHNAATMRQVERDFADILAQAVHHPELIGEYFRELETKLFSNDHGWRDIMEGLIRLSPAYDAYKRVALIKYMQYLRARQNIMRSLFIEKTKGDDNASVNAARKVEDITPFVPGDTAIFDMTQVLVAETSADAEQVSGLCALAKGETVTLHLGQEREVELVLAGNRMRLFMGRDFYLADDDNNTYPLRPGKNLIGRNSGCDVVLDAACRAVSRNHLIVQPISTNEVRLTDLSAHGTEVPVQFLHPQNRQD